MHDTSHSPAKHDPYAALRLGDFRLYLSGNILAVLGTQMQTVAVGWEMYDRTGSNLALGLVGLVQFVPVIALALPAGHVADRLNRKSIVMTCLALMALASFGLALVSAQRGRLLSTLAAWPGWNEQTLAISTARVELLVMYGLLFLSGVARAFLQPAKASFLPQIVPRDRFSNAITWNSGGFHLASVLGPAIGGALIALWHGAAFVYALDGAAALGFLSLLTVIRGRRAEPTQGSFTLRELAAGLRFLRHNQVVFGAITLDMVAVLLGGATMLLPVYAEDILHVGPSGLGWMRTAPAIGALLMSLVLAHRPPLAQAGKALLVSVGGFGIATILFGLSRHYWLSLVALFLTGALDNVSVVIRHTLIQVLTPDELRGRVSAVNGLFIAASNELGGFESGLVAFLFGPTISVVGGGMGTLVAVTAAALAWPHLRRYGRLGSTMS